MLLMRREDRPHSQPPGGSSQRSNSLSPAPWLKGPGVAFVTNAITGSR